MAYIAEAKAKLALDTSDFERGLTRTTASLGRAAGEMGSKLRRAFSPGDVFRGLLQGLGIFGASSIAEKIAEPFRRAAEFAKEIADLSETTANIYARIFKARRSDGENLAFNLSEQASLQKQLAETTEQRGRVLVSGPMSGHVLETEGITREANPKRQKEIENRLAQLQEEEEQLRRKAAGQDKRTADDRAEKVKEISGMQRKMGLEELDANARIAALDKERIEIRREIFRSGVEDLDALKRAVEIDAEIAGLERKRTEETEKRAQKLEDIAKEEEDFARGQIDHDSQLAELARTKEAIQRLITAKVGDEVELRQRLLNTEKDIARVKREQADDAKRAADRQKRENEEAERHAKRLHEVTDRAAEAWVELEREKDDMTGLTVEEMAVGKFSTTQTNKAKAREILRLEEQAKRQRSQGFINESEQSAAKALKLRAHLDGLKINEKDPMAAQKMRLTRAMKEIGITKKDNMETAMLKATLTSESYLKEIRDSLDPMVVSTPTPAGVTRPKAPPSRRGG